MTNSAKKLLDDVLALPADEQRWLADRLLDHLPEPDPDEIDAAWRDEAIRRGEELERGEGSTLDGEAVVQEIARELSSASSRR